MKTLKLWLNQLLRLSSEKKMLDQIDEAGDESFPASDPPSWAGWESKKTAASPSLNTQNPIELLKEEHRALMKAIYLLHEQVERLEQKKPVQGMVLKKIIAFIRQFLENTHHEKEDSLLLPALERCGASLKDCPLTLLKQERETSLSLLVTLEQLLPACEKNEARACEKTLETLNAIKELCTQHTLKEENYIFPLAEKYLTPGVQQYLCAAFTKIDRRTQ